MVSKVVQIPDVGEITLKKNSRSKRIRLYVKPNRKIIVSHPNHVTYKIAEKFALKNTSWILKQLNKLNNDFNEYTPNSVIYTKHHLIKIQENKVEKIKLIKEGQTINILIPENSETEENQEFIQAAITEVYRIEAKQYLPVRLRELARKHGFSYNKVTIRNNKSNWGSCSSSNNISLNLNLMKLPYHLIDYIILHELTHTIVKNHSGRFYDLLDKVTDGKAREFAKEIKNYSTYTY